ncbi:MAG: D-alanyl-D-alanine carboxypeptidase [Pseudomonadales bacterium]|nr:D-alanyl-D-alanine carboxypeptidase [Pseudomonadales bacterium]
MNVMRLIALTILGLFGHGVIAQMILPPPPSIAASGYVLMDAETHTILLEHNSREKLPPASLTKIMTSYVAAAEIAAGSVALDDDVVVSENAWRAVGSRMFIDPNSTVKFSDLLRGVIIQSGNDASVAVAEHVAGSEQQFSVMMNETAKKLGLEDSYFMNSTGLPDADHYMSARDVALLSDALIRDHPEHYRIYSEREFEYNNIKQPNRNRLLMLDPSVDGVKTGYTESAGYCLAVSAKRDDMRLISVVMGAESTPVRTRETRKLLSYGFRNYRTKVLLAEGQHVTDARVWFGTTEQVPIGVGETVKKTMFQRLFDGVTREVILHDLIEAPIAAGKQLGEIRLIVAEEEIARVPLIALAAVEEKGVFGRVWDSVLLMFEDHQEQPQAPTPSDAES